MPPAPVIAAGQFVLRGWAPEDAAFAQSAARDPDISRFSSVGVAASAAEAQRWIESRSAPDRFDWVVTDMGQPIGRVSLAHIDQDEAVAEVGYWVLRGHRRRRVAWESVSAVEHLAFSDLALMRLYIRHEPENVASCAFANSRDYLAEGTQRGAFTRAGARLDLHVHGLLATDGVRQPLASDSLT